MSAYAISEIDSAQQPVASSRPQRSQRKSTGSTTSTGNGIKEFIEVADGEMKALMDYLELAGSQVKKGAELDEINDLKKYIALTLSHWKRNASVATEGYVELAGLLNLEKSVIQSQQTITTEQDHLIGLLTEENTNVNAKVKEVEGLLRSESQLLENDDAYGNGDDDDNGNNIININNTSNNSSYNNSNDDNNNIDSNIDNDNSNNNITNDDYDYNSNNHYNNRDV